MTYDWLPHRWSISIHVFSFGISPFVCLLLHWRFHWNSNFRLFLCAQLLAGAVVSHSNERMVCRLFRSSEGVNLVVLICLLSIGYFSTIYFGVSECQNCTSAEFLILPPKRFHFMNKVSGAMKYILHKAANLRTLITEHRTAHTYHLHCSFRYMDFGWTQKIK